MLSSAIHGDVAESKYLNVLVVAPVGTKVPAAALKVPPVPVNLDHVPPVSSPVIKPTSQLIHCHKLSYYHQFLHQVDCSLTVAMPHLQYMEMLLKVNI
jgi:hypothetical protein